jgi:siroheme synthase (precorrin-2 oxidase/ferrochelatase)
MNCFTLELLRTSGKKRVRSRLENLVNADIIGVAGAQKIYQEAFGDHLIAIKEKRSWWHKLTTRIARRKSNSRPKT